MFPYYSGMEHVQFVMFAVRLVNHDVLGDINGEGKLSLYVHPKFIAFY